ncbi:hypothetical protein SFMTTN_1442 [Sulfuriferula multivorans]|uniref:Uncharacterized protein n=1 Tax=Sulfuriferula multivorans TaxID=1559896 RepID=A0A401JD91_9PROT|nr:hypothetical protein SFMTTN_1442 [Sulfuriferula multivorans]
MENLGALDVLIHVASSPIRGACLSIDYQHGATFQLIE